MFASEAYQGDQTTRAGATRTPTRRSSRGGFRWTSPPHVPSSRRLLRSPSGSPGRAAGLRRDRGVVGHIPGQLTRGCCFGGDGDTGWHGEVGHTPSPGASAAGRPRRGVRRAGGLAARGIYPDAKPAWSMAPSPSGNPVSRNQNPARPRPAREIEIRRPRAPIRSVGQLDATLELPSVENVRTMRVASPKTPARINLGRAASTSFRASSFWSHSRAEHGPRLSFTDHSRTRPEGSRVAHLVSRGVPARRRIRWPLDRPGPLRRILSPGSLEPIVVPICSVADINIAARGTLEPRWPSTCHGKRLKNRSGVSAAFM